MYLNIPPNSLKVVIMVIGLIIYKDGGGGGGLQLIGGGGGRKKEYLVSCGMITHHFNMFRTVERMR